jgi:hypothetical protein
MSMQNNLVISKEVVEFVAIAKDYYTFVESADNPAIGEFVSKTHDILANLYLRAIYLPELDAKYEDYNEHHVTEKDYQNVRKRINEKLGHYDSYHDINSPIKNTSDESAEACISEDMSDIYQEIKDFSMLYKSGRKELMYEAIWECRQSFKNYWGQRLTNSLRALHFLRYSGAELAELNDEGPAFEDDLKVGDLDTTDWIVSEE